MIQFSLTTKCHNNCSFCGQKVLRDINEPTEKILKETKKILLNCHNDFKEDLTKYNSVSFIGGEIFEVDFYEKYKNELYELFDIVLNKLDKRLFLMTNLIYPNYVIKELLNKLNNDKLIFCTSYDIYGRFNENKLKLFNDNFKYLTKNKITTHIEIIVSQTLIEIYLNNPSYFKEFKKKYTNNIDFMLPYYRREEHLDNLDEKFYPKREDFLQFCIQLISNNDYDKERFLNPNNHADVVYYLVKDKLFKINNRNINALSIFSNGLAKYIDSKESMFQDWLNIKGSL